MNDACKEEDKHNNAKNDPVKTEDFKTVFLKIIYEEANCKQGRQQRRPQRQCLTWSCYFYQYLRMFLINIIKTLCRGSKHGRYRQEEENSAARFLVSFWLIPPIIVAALRLSREKHRQNLETSDDKGFWK